jgi:hypothetical protein
MKMDLLDRYVNEVGKHLPRKLRGDIASELHSTLQDMLDDQSQLEDRPADQAMTLELLKRHGSPEKLAASYLPERYLVGPQMYPLFGLVLKIVLIVLGVMALIGLGVAIAAGPTNVPLILKATGRSLLEYYGAAISAFGNIVLVFAILERVLPHKERAELKDEEEWNPTELLKEPEPEAFAAWEPVVTILFSVAAIVIFNFYPHLLRATPSLNGLGTGDVAFYPILSTAFDRYLPWLNVIWVLDIALALLLFRSRRWTKASRLFAIGIKALGIGVATGLLLGPVLLDFSSWPVPQNEIQALVSLLNSIVKLGLVIAIIATAVDIVKHLYRLYFKPQGKRPVVSS